jgi:hypothetical protein
VVRLVGIVLIASILLLGSASAGGAERTDCTVGAISAIGPVDADGRGDTTPDFRCIEP